MSVQRPLSPHLQIYKPQITSMLSISHRIAGVVLLTGCLIFCLVFFLAIAYPSTWDSLYQGLPSWLCVLFSIVVVSAAVYHWLNGIRHSLWDRLIGLELQTVYQSGYALLIAFVVIVTAIVFSWF